MSAACRVVVANLQSGWHSQQLHEAFRKQGCKVQAIELADCRFGTEWHCGLKIPGFAGHLPDVVFVRGIAAGSLQQVTYYLGILHALSALGVVVYNPPQAIERSVDKSMTTFLLQRAGIPTPKRLPAF